MSIQVIQPGMLTTIQDMGREGYGEYGIPVAGAMDRESLKLANLLVDNKLDQGALEITLMGPHLRFHQSTIMSITGGDLSPKVNGQPMQMYKSILVHEGDELTFGGIKSGARAYVAFQGGFDIPDVMGSQSTYIKGKLGGFEGRKLKAGDRLALNKNEVGIHKEREIPSYLKRQFGHKVDIRVILGSEEDAFSKEGLHTFLNKEYTVSSQSDRMGYRLTGDKIEHKDSPDILSGGIQLGAIQVPGHGEPIIMMADRQITGGYTKIAHVITEDLPYLAQLKPGGKVRFSVVSLQVAWELMKRRHREIQGAQTLFKQGKYYQVKVNGQKYSLCIQQYHS